MPSSHAAADKPFSCDVRLILFFLYKADYVSVAAIFHHDEAKRQHRRDDLYTSRQTNKGVSEIQVNN